MACQKNVVLAPSLVPVGMSLLHPTLQSTVYEKPYFQKCCHCIPCSYAVFPFAVQKRHGLLIEGEGRGGGCTLAPKSMWDMCAVRLPPIP